MQLTKAYLHALDPNIPHIHFMFNPTDLAFTQEVASEENTGARAKETGAPKTNFSHLKPRTLTISKILFDTYEEKTDVQAYIRPFLCAVEFVSYIQKIGGLPDKLYNNLPEGTRKQVKTSISSEFDSSSGGGDDKKKQQRTPIYRFIWGNQENYLPYCTVDSLSYKLTKFLPNGTPVRAEIDSLTLKETSIRPNMNDKADREVDSLKNRLGIL
ncbi:hypothetical protein [Okeania sp. SIO2G5]|uniref:CIS tube protein n=1 Tax=Okeania sp. SIO2G5 TaxID=2607796 RepID=UPI0013BFE157|nr:hypothetical protein [Okeania sp. SIO2G5]NEP76498.1 hypothetical protein [Okeania sp. SIO2G5]